MSYRALIQRYARKAAGVALMGLGGGDALAQVYSAIDPSLLQAVYDALTSGDIIRSLAALLAGGGFIFKEATSPKGNIEDRLLALEKRFDEIVKG